jgi:hypothetical protein
MRLQGRNTTATVRLTTDLPNIRPVRLQVGPGRTGETPGLELIWEWI